MAGSQLTRRDRESRAFALTLATGGGGVATVATFVLAVLGAAGWGLFFILLVATVVLLSLLRRTLGR